MQRMCGDVDATLESEDVTISWGFMLKLRTYIIPSPLRTRQNLDNYFIIQGDIYFRLQVFRHIFQSVSNYAPSSQNLPYYYGSRCLTTWLASSLLVLLRVLSCRSMTIKEPGLVRKHLLHI